MRSSAERPVGADPAVDVPGHHADGAGSARSRAALRRCASPAPGCRARRRSRRPPPARTGSTLSGVGSVSTLKIWWPSADISTSPGSMPEDGAEHVVGERDPAGAGGEIDQRERRDRHHAHGGDREHAAAGDGAPDAVEPRPQHVLQRLPADQRADAIGQRPRWRRRRRRHRRSRARGRRWRRWRRSAASPEIPASPPTTKIASTIDRRRGHVGDVGEPSLDRVRDR